MQACSYLPPQDLRVYVRVRDKILHPPRTSAACLRGAMEKIQRYFKGALERRRDANSAVLPSMEAPPFRTAVVGTTEIKEKTMLDDMVAESPPRKGLNKTA